MMKSKLIRTNKKIEKKVVGAYKAVEDGVVETYKKVEDKFVDCFLTKEGETVLEAKERLRNEQKARENAMKAEMEKQNAKIEASLGANRSNENQ